MSDKIEIWSTYPPPFGGVSIHSMRLFNILKAKYNLVFKNFNGNINAPENGIIKVDNQLKEIIGIFFKKKRNIHLHSNRLIVWFIMLFSPKYNRILLTLHNQNLKKELSFSKNLLVKMFLRKVKYIFLNNQTFAKYLAHKYGLSINKFIIIPAFIPPLKEESKELPKEISSFFNKFDKTISSFAWKLYLSDNKDVYGIEHIIEAFNLVKKSYENVGLILIIPIIEDKDHYNRILKAIKDYNLSNSIFIYNKAIRNGFDIWGKSDLFLRATTTDIEGISIKEALMLDTPVIATDVVERPKGVSLYKYGDVEQLSTLILKELNNPIKKTYKNDIASGIEKIDKVYNALIN